ncbi:uncharacterized protein Dvar_11010 [Desulfosarcina variabilis str. Montpellier]
MPIDRFFYHDPIASPQIFFILFFREIKAHPLQDVVILFWDSKSACYICAP